MATSDIPVTFLDIHNNSWYFEEEKDDLEEDTFQKFKEILKFHIRSTDSKLLMLTAKDNFQFESSAASSGNEICVQFYINSGLEQKKGRAVMLYANKNRQKMVACCCEGSYLVHAKAMELPKELNGKKDEALFYMIGLSATNKFVFESTLHPSWFLGCQPDNDNPSRHKLVLIHQNDEMDHKSLCLTQV